MHKKILLTTALYINACNRYGIKISGGTIHDFLRSTIVKYYGGKCPIWQVEYFHNNQRVVIGGKYAYDKKFSKPKLEMLEELNFD